MTSEERILGYLGLAARGGNIVSGDFSTEKSVKTGKARLVVLAGDSSDNTKEKYEKLCASRGIPCFSFSDRETIGRAVGKDWRACLAVTDSRLAAAVLKVREEV